MKRRWPDVEGIRPELVEARTRGPAGDPFYLAELSDVAERDLSSGELQHQVHVLVARDGLSGDATGHSEVAEQFGTVVEAGQDVLAVSPQGKGGSPLQALLEDAGGCE